MDEMLPFHVVVSNRRMRMARRTSRRAIELVTLLALLTGPVSADPDPSDAVPRLALHWIDGFRVCPAIRKIAMGEAEAIIRRSGVQVVWREPLEAVYARPNEMSVKVILVATHPSQWHLDSSSLGATMGTGAPRESAYIFGPNALAFLGIDYRPGTCPSPRTSHIIGRALARILVHEIVHAVAPEHPHSESGLMAPSIGHDELTARALGIDEACARVFHTAFHHHAALHRDHRQGG